MPRAIWSGSLAFGLVSVPVRVVSAAVDRDVRFRYVHATDGAPIRHERVCADGHRDVPWEEVAHLYPKGEPVVLTKEELDQVGMENNERIEVLDFVRVDDVDPLYFENAYYLVPMKGGDRAYRLLVEAMRATGRAGVGKVVMRGRERLVLVRPLGSALSMMAMSHGDEVLLPEEVEGLPERGRLPRRELELAERLIEEMSADFDPARYHDERRARVLDLIDAKREGAILLPPPRPPRGAPEDLVEALEASLREARQGRAEA